MQIQDGLFPVQCHLIEEGRRETELCPYKRTMILSHGNDQINALHKRAGQRALHMSRRVDAFLAKPLANGPRAAYSATRLRKMLPVHTKRIVRVMAAVSSSTGRQRHR